MENNGHVLKKRERKKIWPTHRKISDRNCLWRTQVVDLAGRDFNAVNYPLILFQETQRIHT
jgi:hypothetical protein